MNKKREIREITRNTKEAKPNKTEESKGKEKKRITTKRKALTKIFLKYTTLHTYTY